MTSPLEAFAIALGATFLAELGDKTQLAVVMLAERFKPWPLFVAASLALVTSAILAATLGGLLGSLGGTAGFGPWLSLASGLAFILFGVLGLVALKREDTEAAATPSGKRLFLIVFTAIFSAELGDKTQIATALFASQGYPVWAGLGSALALVLSTALAVLAGRALTRLQPQYKRLIRLTGALAFLAIGLFQVVQAVIALVE